MFAYAMEFDTHIVMGVQTLPEQLLVAAVCRECYLRRFARSAVLEVIVGGLKHRCKHVSHPLDCQQTSY